MRAWGVLLVLFLTFVFLANGNDKYFHKRERSIRSNKNEEGRDKQKRDNEFAGAQEFNSSIDDFIANGQASYFITLAPGEVADLAFTVSSRSIVVTITLGGTDDAWTFIDNITGLTLAYHCPALGAKYYITIETDPANAELNVTNRRSPNINGNTVGEAFYLTTGFIGIPIATQCQQLVVDVQQSDIFNPNLYYECRDQNNLFCTLSPDLARYFVYTAADDSNLHNQFYVNCTQPGTYYLNLIGNPSTYNVTLYNNYPCPENCWNGGICNMVSGACECNSGYEGPSCTPTPANNYVTATLPTDGSVYNLTDALAHQDLSGKVFQLEIPVTQSSSSGIHLQLIIEIVDRQILDATFFLNPGSYASSSNYSVDISSNGNFNETYDIHLCNAASVWYFSYNAYFTLPFIYITAIPENFSAITTDFSGTFGNGRVTDIQLSVFHYVATQAQFTVEIEEQNPAVTGVYVVGQCGAFISFDAGSIDGTYYVNNRPRLGHYQISISSANTGQDYYIVVEGISGANFSGSVSTERIGACDAENGCDNGYCTSANTCQCYDGYGGRSCDTVVLPPNDVELINNGTMVLPLSNGYFYDSLTYASTPVMDAGSTFRIKIGAPEALLGWSGTSVPLPVAYDAQYSDFGIDGIEDYYYVEDSGCISRTPQQYFLAFYAKLGGTVDVTLEILDPVVSSTGEPKVVQILTGITVYAFIAYPDPTTCTGAYNITITGNIAYGSVGSGGQFCNEHGPYLLNNVGSSQQYLLGVNCSDAIDISFHPLTSAGTVTITVTPTTACPGNCNNNGVCLPGGVCQCHYPYIGDDCGSYDVECTVPADDYICKSNIPSFYNVDFDNNAEFCYIEYFSSLVPVQMADTISTLSDAGITLSQTCQNELLQILCDNIKFPCQNQEAGGIKLLAPCNCHTFYQRCAPSLNSSLYHLDTACTAIDTTMEQHPGIYICNPDPSSENYTYVPPPGSTSSGMQTTGTQATATQTTGSTSQTSSQSTGTSGTTGGNDGTSSAQSSTASNSGESTAPDSSTTTGNNESGTWRLYSSVYCFTFFILIIVL